MIALIFPSIPFMYGMTFDDASNVSLDIFSGMAKRRSSFVPKYS
jgi:hypothetical protein